MTRALATACGVGIWFLMLLIFFVSSTNVANGQQSVTRLEASLGRDFVCAREFGASGSELRLEIKDQNGSTLFSGSRITAWIEMCWRRADTGIDLQPGMTLTVSGGGDKRSLTLASATEGTWSGGTLAEFVTAAQGVGAHGIYGGGPGSEIVYRFEDSVWYAYSNEVFERAYAPGFDPSEVEVGRYDGDGNITMFPLVESADSLVLVGPQAEHPEFDTALPSDGVVLATWSGGRLEEVRTAGRNAGCGIESFWVSQQGDLIGYVVGAPEFVNQAMTDLFPDQRLPSSRPLLIVCNSRIPAGILIDASRDGGSWWVPQRALEPLPPGSPHYVGGRFVAYLEARGYEVSEIPRAYFFDPPNRAAQGRVTLDELERYALVIRADEYPPDAYTDAEYSAYRDYVAGGGRLLLQADYSRPGTFDGLARVFGFDVRGITRGPTVVESFATDPVTDGVGSFFIDAGGAILSAPSGATLLAHLPSDIYVDLNDDEVRQPTEPTGSAVMATLEYGQGRVFLVTDLEFFRFGSPPLVDNVIDWLLE